MSVNVPKIDQRNQKDLVEQIRALAIQYCSEWGPAQEEALTSIEADKQADALIHIFAWMMENIIQRLNKSPDKNFMSFLDLIGVRLSPPQVARAPLVFTMSAGSGQYGFIPAGIQVAAQTKDQEAVVFETEKDLTIILPKLVKAVSLDPEGDRWTDHSPGLLNKEKNDAGKNEEILFTGKNLVTHRLYLGDDQLFSFKEPATITLDITLQEEIDLQEWEVKWYYYAGDPSEPKDFLNVTGIAVNSTGQEIPNEVDDNGNEIPNPDVINLLRSGIITFSNVSGIAEKTLTGFENKTNKTEQINLTSRWIFAELKTPLTSTLGIKLPQINNIMANIQINYTQLLPELAFFNNIPLDLTKDFYPFGEKPRCNDTWYIGSEEIFSKVGAIITIDVILSDMAPTPDPEKIKLSWEFWDGNRWQLIGVTTGVTTNDETVPDTSNPYEFIDNTSAFTLDGSKSITFICPEITKDKIRPFIDQESYWIRVRITGGGYGEEADYISKTGTDAFGNEVEVWVYQKPTFQPPLISKFTIGYDFSYEPSQRPQYILTYNDFWYHDQSTDEQLSIKPFELAADTHLALYLAFGQDISTLPVTLFFPLLENILTSSQDHQNQSPPIIAWQYWDGMKWLPLSVEDNTRNFTRREVLQFLAPDDIVKFPFFENELYWIRAVLEGKHAAPPKLRAIYTNTVWSQGLTAVNNEILGSSNGEPDQIFTFSNFPVLPGQKVLVRETALTEEERQTILSEEGKDAIEEICDEAGNIIEIWVRWHKVQSFFVSESHSRHYIINRNSGTITFGDAQRGKIPPAGKDTIKCSRYQYGGGAKGNVKVGTITQLRTTFPYIESVTNPVAAEGGFDQENIDHVRIRGPQTIKHRDRAVTYEDFEWLVREAAPKVAKVRCLPTTDTALQFSPGWITIIIVPESEDPKPLPSQELISEIEEYLLVRASTHFTTLNPPLINIIGPGYIQVGVEAWVQYTSMGAAKIIEGRIIDNLKSFFHPLYGGPEKKGWDFGRNVYISEVCEVIENTEGVDYVEKLNLEASVQIYKLDLRDGGITPPISYPAHSRVTSDKILFCWDKIKKTSQDADGTWQDPEDSDNSILREFLREYFGVDWADAAKIEISIDESVIVSVTVSEGVNSLTLSLNNEETKVVVTNEEEAGEFIVIMEDYQRNVYGKMILFCWDKIKNTSQDADGTWQDPEDSDNSNLRGFLREYFGVEWADTAKIVISTEGSVTVSKDDNSLTLSLNTGETKVIVTIKGEKAGEFIVIMEDDQRNIYGKMILIFSLAEGLSAGREVDTLTVAGFKEGDQIFLRDSAEKISLLVKSVQRNAPEFILECENCEPFKAAHEYLVGSIVETRDQRIRSFTTDSVDVNGDIIRLKVAIIQTGDEVVLSYKDKSKSIGPITIESISTDYPETIFIDDNYLIYSGAHVIKNEEGKNVLTNT